MAAHSALWMHNGVSGRLVDSSIGLRLMFQGLFSNGVVRAVALLKPAARL